MASLNARIEKSISCHSSVFTFHQQNKNRSKNTHENSNNSYYNYNKIITVGLITTCSVAYIASKKKTAFSEQAENVVPGEFIDNLPVYTECDVAKHSTKENGIWVIYKNGVYDVTDFVEQHPGGTKILLAAGSSIEPFWALYAVHHTPEVYGILEEHRIGNIKSVETKKDANPLDPYSEDPKRHPALIPASEKPFNAEPPPSLLVDNIYTPK